MTPIVSLTDLCTIARTHGFEPPATMPVPWTGATSQVFPCGDVVIKIPFERPDAIQAIQTEAAMVPIARSLGVVAPALIAFDDSRDVLPVPYAVFECVRGAVALETRRSEGRSTWDAWAETGRQLAAVHGVRDPDDVPIALRTFRQSPDLDPRPWVVELHGAGAVDAPEARWLHDLLDVLAPSALADVPITLCHGDVNAANVLVDGETGRFRALIDWSGVGWLDPVWDFAGVPLDVVPAMLAGHRSVAPLENDGSAEARILWSHVQTRLHPLREATADATITGTLRRHLAGIRRFAHVAGLT